jgi:hypothetical protein
MVAKQPLKKQNKASYYLTIVYKLWYNIVIMIIGFSDTIQDFSHDEHKRYAAVIYSERQAELKTMFRLSGIAQENEYPSPQPEVNCESAA